MAVLVATAQSVKSALARLLIGMAGVYTLQSLAGGLMNAGLTTFLRNQGLVLDAIGLLSVLMLPWVLNSCEHGQLRAGDYTIDRLKPLWHRVK